MIRRPKGAEGQPTRRQPAKVKPAFGRIRDAAAQGDIWAQERLRHHVVKRKRAGWGWLTISKRLGLSVEDVVRLAAVVDLTPRLVRGTSAVDTPAIRAKSYEPLPTSLEGRMAVESSDE